MQDKGGLSVDIDAAINIIIYRFIQFRSDSEEILLIADVPLSVIPIDQRGWLFGVGGVREHSEAHGTCFLQKVQVQAKKHIHGLFGDNSR